MSSACRLNLSGKGTCKLTQLIMKQTSKLSSVICKVRIRSQQTNSPLLSPDKRARACAHTHTHTHTHTHIRFFMAHVLFSNISYTYFCFSSLYFCSHETVFHSFQAVQTGSVSTNSNTALLSAEEVVLRHTALDFVCYWMRAHNHGGLLVLSMCLIKVKFSRNKKL